MSDGLVYASILQAEDPRREVTFHASEGCPQLRRAPKVVQIDLQKSMQPCLVCYPDFPRLSVVHRRCRACGHSKPTPCSHNGGVMVLVPGVGRADSRRWVWPEHAYRYRLAPEATPV